MARSMDLSANFCGFLAADHGRRAEPLSLWALSQQWDQCYLGERKSFRFAAWQWSVKIVKWNSRELPWNSKKRWRSRWHTIAASQVSCCLEVFNRLWKWGVSLSQVQNGTCAWLCCDCSIQRVSYQIYRPVWNTNQSFCCTCSPTEELHVIWTEHISSTSFGTATYPRIHANLCGTVHSSVPPWVAAAAWGKLWALTAWRLGSERSGKAHGLWHPQTLRLILTNSVGCLTRHFENVKETSSASLSFFHTKLIMLFSLCPSLQLILYIERFCFDLWPALIHWVHAQTVDDPKLSILQTISLFLSDCLFWEQEHPKLRGEQVVSELQNWNSKGNPGNRCRNFLFPSVSESATGASLQAAKWELGTTQESLQRNQASVASEVMQKQWPRRERNIRYCNCLLSWGFIADL